MCACLGMCVHVCMRACAYVCMRVCMYVCMCGCMHRIRVRVCVFLSVMVVCACLCLCVCILKCHFDCILGIEMYEYIAPAPKSMILAEWLLPFGFAAICVCGTISF